MGLRFRKSFKLLPGVRINLNKNSSSVTFGKKGVHYTVNSKGKRTATAGIPGTGISYSESTMKKKNSTQKTGKKKPGCMTILLVLIGLSLLGSCFGGSDQDSSEATTAVIEEATTEIIEETTTEVIEEATTEISEEATTAKSEEVTTESVEEVTTEEIVETTTEEQEERVWIPNSGSKYHSSSSCSNMNNPTEVTISKAKSLGYEACKRCH